MVANSSRGCVPSRDSNLGAIESIDEKTNFCYAIVHAGSRIPKAVETGYLHFNEYVKQLSSIILDIENMWRKVRFLILSRA